MHLRLDDVAEIGLGASAHGRSVVGQGDSEMPFVNIKDVRDGYIDFGNVDLMPVSDKEKVARYVLKEGDIVVTMRGSAFRAALVDGLKQDTLISANLAYLRLKPGAPISPGVLCAWLRSPDGRRQAELLQHGAGILSISAKDLKNMPVSVPDRHTQGKLEELMKVAAEHTQLTEKIRIKREVLLEAAVVGCFNMKFKYTKECA